MMSRVGEALSRKFGPLPAWAWAGIGFVAILLYRRYKGQQDSIGTAISPISPVGQIQGGDQSTTPRDPVVLGPGESIYDPVTGKLTGPGGDGNGTEPAPGPAGPPGPPGPPGATVKVKPPKRRPKPKAGHVGPKKPAPAPHHKKKTPDRYVRAGSSRLTKIRGKINKPAASKAAHPARPQKQVKPRQRVLTAASQSPAPERAVAQMPPRPALRQHPAATRVVDHSTQQTVNRSAATKHVNPPPPPPAPKRVVAPKKRK